MMAAESFGDRFHGLRKLEPGSSILIRTSSVHGFGFRRPFHAVGLDDQLTVVSHTIVQPWRVARFPGCVYVMEMPIETTPPPVGARLEMGDV